MIISLIYDFQIKKQKKACAMVAYYALYSAALHCKSEADIHFVKKQSEVENETVKLLDVHSQDKI